MKYQIIKSVCCGGSSCWKVGSNVGCSGDYTNINKAFAEADTYNKKKCGCQVEVKEIKEGE